MTEQTIKEAIFLYKEKRMSVLDISKFLGVNYGDLRRNISQTIKLRNSGEVNRKTSPEEEKIIIDKYLKGATVRSLSREYGYDCSVFNRILRENNIQKHSSKKLHGKNVDSVAMYEQYKKEQNFSSIARSFGIRVPTVIRKLREIDPNIKSNLKDINKQLSLLPQSLQKEICDLYLSGVSCSKLSTKFNIDRGAISRCLRANNIQKRNPGIDNRIYSINPQVFKPENIHTPQSYLVLGLIYTDGGVRYFEKKSFTIELNENDRDVLDFVNLSIGSNRPLLINKKKNTLILTVSNKQMALDLINLGCVPNKTLCLKFPSWVRGDLFHHFLHGCIIGDGWLFEGKGKSFNFGIVGTEDICRNIQNELYKRLGIKGSLSPACGGKVWDLTISGNNQVLRVCNFIFKDAPFVLKRKFDVFRRLVELKQSSPGKASLNDINEGARIIDLIQNEAPK